MSEEKGLNLAFWVEAVGTLESVDENNDGTVVLTLSMQGKHVKIKVLGVKKDLRRYIGQRIGVLRIDSHQQQYLIRRVRVRVGGNRC